ncbi:MAG: DUF2147 domain-containing protein [Bacteroidales bacterium]|nr:DUF2147 domain-containing protein [Bacteroidales bacterium]
MNKNVGLLIFILCLANWTMAQDAGDKILGIYSVIEVDTKEESHVKIYKTENGTYQGKFIWLKNPNLANGKPKLDINNTVLLKNFKYDSKKNEWRGGTIYDPIHGKVYDCYLKFENDKKLKVRGFIGVPMLGKSMYWTKIK